MTNSLREDLVAAMARIYGYEHPNTIEFAYLCENPRMDINSLMVILKCHEKHPEY